MDFSCLSCIGQALSGGESLTVFVVNDSVSGSAHYHTLISSGISALAVVASAIISARLLYRAANATREDSQIREARAEAQAFRSALFDNLALVAAHLSDKKNERRLDKFVRIDTTPIAVTLHKILLQLDQRHPADASVVAIISDLLADQYE